MSEYMHVHTHMHKKMGSSVLWEFCEIESYSICHRPEGIDSPHPQLITSNTYIFFFFLGKLSRAWQIAREVRSNVC